MNYNIGLNAYANTYSFDYVNCFEKPLSIIVNNDDEALQSFFLVYLKMIQSYNISGYDDPEFFYTVNFNRALSYILGDKLGYEYRIEEVKPSNIHHLIKEYIDRGWPVLVPGNLYELSYSEYYQTGDWKHLFLINGYHEEKETYSVIDNNHEPKNEIQKYSETLFSYTLLEKLYTSAKEKLKVPSVWSINRTQDFKELNELELLEEIIHVFLHCKKEHPYKEIDYIHQINREIDENTVDLENEKESDVTKQIDFIFIRTIKYKDTFYNELHTLLKKRNVPSEMLHEFNQIKTQLNRSWTNIMNEVLVNRYLMQKTLLDESLIYIQNKEKKMDEIIYRISQELERR